MRDYVSAIVDICGQDRPKSEGYESELHGKPEPIRSAQTLLTSTVEWQLTLARSAQSKLRLEPPKCRLGAVFLRG